MIDVVSYVVLALLAFLGGRALMRRNTLRDLDKELAPPGADLLDLRGRRW